MSFIKSRDYDGGLQERHWGKRQPKGPERLQDEATPSAGPDPRRRRPAPGVDTPGT